MFLSVQLELKKGNFELTNQKSLMVIKYMEPSNETSFFEITIRLARINVVNSVFVLLIFVFFHSYQFILATTISVPVFFHFGIMI